MQRGCGPLSRPCEACDPRRRCFGARSKSALQSHYVWASRSVRCPPIVLVQEFPFWGFGHARQEPDNCIGGLGCRRGSGRCRSGVRVALSAQFRCANGCRARNPRARSGRGRAPVSRVDSGAGDWHQVDGQALQVLQALKALEALQVLQTPPLGQLNSVCRMAPCVSPGPSCIWGWQELPHRPTDATSAVRHRRDHRRPAGAPLIGRATAWAARFGRRGQCTETRVAPHPVPGVGGPRPPRRTPRHPAPHRFVHRRA